MTVFQFGLHWSVFQLYLRLYLNCILSEFKHLDCILRVLWLYFNCNLTVFHCIFLHFNSILTILECISLYLDCISTVFCCILTVFAWFSTVFVCISTVFWLYFNSIQNFWTVFEMYFDRFCLIFDSFWVYFNSILSVFQMYFNCILNTILTLNQPKFPLKTYFHQYKLLAVESLCFHPRTTWLSFWSPFKAGVCNSINILKRLFWFLWQLNPNKACKRL